MLQSLTVLVYSGDIPIVSKQLYYRRNGGIVNNSVSTYKLQPRRVRANSGIGHKVILFAIPEINQVRVRYLGD